jgi:energy-coupling factor transporter ATP-binding protein EcfA2
MIKLIVGNKGSGKTKTLIRMVNEAVKMTSGNVVCVEKGLKLTYDISHQARLVDIEHYGVSGFVAFGGFLCGLMAGNYDITDIFVDATLRIGGRELEEFAKMLDKLLPLAEENNTTLTFTVSCDISELPERIKRYAV